MHDSIRPKWLTRSSRARLLAAAVLMGGILVAGSSTSSASSAASAGPAATAGSSTATGEVPRDFGYPGISITDYSRVGDVASLPIDRHDNTYQLVDNFSLIRGAHSLKAGVEARILQLNAYIEIYSRGQINFTGAMTGSGIGDLLVGLPTLGIQSQYTGPQTLRGKSWSGYFQDDWKVTRNLTLNLGVRYEYDTPPTDPTNRMATFDFKDGITEPVGTNGLSRSGTRPAPHNFAPRVGFAWSPLKNTVVRGGRSEEHTSELQSP